MVVATAPEDRETIVAWDREYVWRPYMAVEDHRSRDTMVIQKAEGSWLFDVDGRRYLDGNASWWACNLGHGHPRLVQALVHQAQTLAHCSMGDATHAPGAVLAKKLIEVAPAGLSRVFYSDNGSTAVESALKIAVQYWQQVGEMQRTRFLALPRGYHGDSVGAMSVGDVPEFQKAFSSMLFSVERAPEPSDCTNGWQGVADWFEEYLGKHGAFVAGVVAEPMIQGAGGMRFWPKEVLQRIRVTTRAAGSLFVADEVFTGYGRTGPMWACDHAGIKPDLMCVAKGFSGGMLPFSATLATREIYEGFSGGRAKALLHGHTFCGNPLGAAVAAEVLSVYQEEDTLNGVRLRSETLGHGFRELEPLSAVHNVRSLGMVAAMEIGEPGYLGDLGWKVHEKALGAGVYIRPLGNTVYVVPPLNITESDLSHLISTVCQSIEEVVCEVP